MAPDGTVTRIHLSYCRWCKLEGVMSNYWRPHIFKVIHIKKLHLKGISGASVIFIVMLDQIWIFDHCCE